MIMSLILSLIDLFNKNLTKKLKYADMFLEIDRL